MKRVAVVFHQYPKNQSYSPLFTQAQSMLTFNQSTMLESKEAGIINPSTQKTSSSLINFN